MNSRLDERYRNDAAFKRATDFIMRMIGDSDLGLTSLDIRDAAFLARLKHEMIFSGSITFSPEMNGHLKRILATEGKT